MTRTDDEFAAIARANPDLAVGDSFVTLRRGNDVASLLKQDFESHGSEIGRSIIDGTDFMVPWAAVADEPKLMGWAIAEGAYRWAVLRAFHMPPYDAQQVLKRATHFLYFAASLRPGTEECTHG